MESLNFTDRLTYLAWAAGWKAHYKHVSQEIRRLKAVHKKEAPELSIEFYTANRELIRKRMEANELLITRAASKVKAGRQRAAAKEAKECLLLENV